MKSRNYARSVQSQTLRNTAPLIDPTVKTLWFALHSEDPGSNDSQTLHEIPGLGRAAFARAATAWTWDGEAALNATASTMPPAQKHAGQRVATHWTIGLDASGPGQVLFSGRLEHAQEIIEGLVVDIPVGAIRSDEF